MDAVFVLGALPDEAVVRYDAVEPLHAPSPDQCVRLPPKMPGGVHVGIMEVLDLRLDPATLPLADPHPDADARAELRGWTRFADGRSPIRSRCSSRWTPTTASATFRIGSTGSGAHLQTSSFGPGARPAPGRLGIRMTAGRAAGGMVDETCTWWDSRGHVVAQLDTARSGARLRLTSPEPSAGSRLPEATTGPQAACAPSSSPSSSSSGSGQSHEQ